VFLFAFLIWGGIAPAQEDETRPERPTHVGSGAGPTDEAAPNDGVGPDVGIAYSRVLRDTGAPYNQSLRNITIPFRSDPKLGGVEGDIWGQLPLPRLRASVPLLRRGNDPQDAHFKLGPVYIRFYSISAGLLMTDNANLSHDDREFGVIGVIRSGMIVRAQITEGFQFSLSGVFTALPFEGSAGITGFGRGAPFFAWVDDPGPLMEGQLSYETRVGGWDVTIADDYHVNFGEFHEGYQDGFLLFEGFDYYDVDRVGRYSFSPLRQGGGGADFDSRERSRENLDVVYLSNAVSLKLERLLPGGIRLRARAFHEDLWYNQDDRGLPNSRDQVNVYTTLERENLRFKPWAEYRATRVGGADGFNQAVRFGLYGPITDQLAAHGHVGYFMGHSGRRTFLGGAGLRHVAGPYTRQSLGYIRELDEFEDEIHDYLYYTLSQTLGPQLMAQVLGRYGWRESTDSGQRRESWRAGLRIWYILSPRTQIGTGVTYGKSETGEWLGTRFRLEYQQYFSDHLSGRFAYGFHMRNADDERDSYYENVVYVGVTHHFQ
jgi:hypothetical protein